MVISGWCRTIFSASSIVNVFGSGKLNSLFEDKYGPYKDSELQLERIDSGFLNDDPIEVFLRKVGDTDDMDKVDMEGLGEWSQVFAKKLWIKFDNVKDMGDGSVVANFNRIVLGEPYK